MKNWAKKKKHEMEMNLIIKKNQSKSENSAADATTLISFLNR